MRPARRAIGHERQRRRHQQILPCRALSSFRLLKTLAHVWYQAVPYYTHLRYIVVPRNWLGVIPDDRHGSERRHQGPDASRQVATGGTAAEARPDGSDGRVPPQVLAIRGEAI